MNHPPSFDLQCQDKQLCRAAIWDIILEVPTGSAIESLLNEILNAMNPCNAIAVPRCLKYPEIDVDMSEDLRSQKIWHCLLSSKTLVLGDFDHPRSLGCFVGVQPWSPTREHLESFGHLWFPVCLVPEATLAIRTPVCLHQTDFHVKDSVKTGKMVYVPCKQHK